MLTLQAVRDINKRRAIGLPIDDYDLKDLIDTCIYVYERFNAVRFKPIFDESGKRIRFGDA